MKIPGPDHPIAITPHPRRVRVTHAGRLLAETSHALSLKEATYPPVLYIPRADVDMSALAPSDHTSHCPYKGDASYFTVTANGKTAQNAVWSYEHPYPAMAPIAGHVAFYTDRVDAIEELPG